MNRTLDVAIAPDLAGLEPFRSLKSRWPALLAGGLTVAMIIGLGHELFGSGLKGLYRAVPSSPLYYVCFVLLYLAVPIGDYVIFRRLWALPLDGLVALMKKRIANDVVLGYTGEAYFYAWARQRARLVTAPFGAVKDVSILSAMAGNGVTLALSVLALPFAATVLTPPQLWLLYLAVPAMVLMSAPFLLFSRRVFSLGSGQLRWIACVQTIRVVASALLLALAWHFAMPGVTLGPWLLMSAARMLLSRVPFVPNKDLLFANFAIILIGENNQLSEMVAFTSALVLLVHVSQLGAFGLQGLMRKK